MKTSTWKKQDRVNFKAKLKLLCVEIVKGKIDEAKTSMERAQEAANSEGKSSMGDKYETSKVMGQIDSDRAGLQFFEGKKQLAQLNQVQIDVIYKEVQAGAFINCGDINYFILSSIGAKVIDDVKINIISTQAPVATQLLGKKAGDNFTLNGKEIAIREVF